MPMPLSCSVMNSELVSMRSGVSSSLPTAMIAAVAAHARRARRAHTQPPGRQRARIRPRISRLPYTAAIPSSAMTPSPPGRCLEPRGGPRLDHVEHAEHEEADERAEPVHRQERQRDQHADDFVDDDRAGIDAAEMALRFGAAPDADDEQHQDRHELDDGRAGAADQRRTRPARRPSRTCQARPAHSRYSRTWR